MGAVPAMDAELDLAIRFVNTYDLLETPPDLLSIPKLVRMAHLTGHDDLAARFGALDATPAGDEAVNRLRALRALLYPVFVATDDPGAVAAMNDALDHAHGRPRLRIDADGSVRFGVGRPDGTDPVEEMAALATDALARALAVGGAARFGTCSGDPCRCVYVDRSRAGRQKFCCELCNDRMAAAAYRSRRSER
jgi:predicted RNA-binding Zn ribbon-like protein